MPPERPLIPTSVAHLQVMLTDDGSRTLRDLRLNETYHSGCGALSECLTVYLRNSGIEALLHQPPQVHHELRHREAGQSSPAGEAAPPARRTVRVLELGFGTGMAALLTMAAAEAHESPLEYVTLERHLLPRDVLEQLQIGDAIAAAIQRGLLPTGLAVASDLERAWLEFRSRLPVEPKPGEYIWDAEDGLRLRLVIGDAVGSLAQPSLQATEAFDAIYLDAFSPATDPELWVTELFASLKTALQPAGLLVSYCVSGAVRRGLEQAGFEIEKLPGPPGGKREVLAARHSRQAYS